MNNALKRVFAVALVLLTLSALTLTAFAEYSTASNSGIPGEICTSLEGRKAEDYYAGDDSYAVLSALNDSELLSELRSLMTETHRYKSSYNDSKNFADKTDCKSGDGSIVLLYTGISVKTADFIGSGSVGWNREHVWPKSLGGFGNDGAGADLHHVRPDDVTTNSKRGNLKYGNVENGTDVKGSSLVSGALGGYSGNGYFEPLDSVKGDVARICLYVYVRYGGELSQCSSITNVFESIDVLLEWCELDPVDTWEMGRNEVVAAKQGNRNVFIDYPEFAWLVFGREVPENMQTPSGMAMRSDITTAQVTEDVPASGTEAETEAEITTENTPEDTEALTQSPESGCGASAGVAMILIIPIAFMLKARRVKHNSF